MTGILIFAVVVLCAAIFVYYEDTGTMSTEEIVVAYSQKPTNEFYELLKVTDTKYQELQASVEDKDIEEQDLVLNAYVQKRYDEVQYQMFLEKPSNHVITEADKEHYQEWKKSLNL